MKHICLTLLMALVLLSGCTERVAKEHTDKLPEIFPDYIGVTIPRSIAPLNFSVPGAAHMTVVVRGESQELRAQGDDHVEMDIDEWHRITQQGEKLTLEVSAWDEQHPEGMRYGAFDIYLSSDTIDPWIMYRLIPPGYEGFHDMGIYQRCLSNFDERTITNNDDNGRGCMNCHSVCQGNPDHFTFHSRGPHGGTIIQRGGQMKLVSLPSLEPGLQGSYNAWHPSGRYIAFSSNRTVQAFMARSQDKIEGYDLRGDIIIYDADQNRVCWDERFTNEEALESFPSFSPDAQWLYFVSARPVVMPTEFEQLRYSILRVPFDPETGQLGEQVDTVYSAHEQQGSAITPRISPDGRWLMYAVSPTGALHLYHKDADLGMIDLETGELVDCSALNSPCSESYHSWSRNSRWVIYSSKRIDGRFTRPYITHWDGKQWTKPFLLPQQDPKHNTLLMFAYNVPDFLVSPVKISRSRIRELLGVK